jgi:hypothetical protein
VAVVTKNRNGPTGQTVAVVDRNQAYRNRYVSEASANMANYLSETTAPTEGRIIGLSKEGQIVHRDDGSVVSDHLYRVLDEETLWGWIKFQKDAPPVRHMGLISEGFMPPRREELDDTDEDAWPIGLNNVGEDPWKMQLAIVLQSVETDELLTFSALSVTGRNACNRLLRHCQRVRRLHPGALALIRLRVGSYLSKRGMRVNVPNFVGAGHTSADNASTSRDELDDPSPIDFA